jgi:hypothetical protein
MMRNLLAALLAAITALACGQGADTSTATPAGEVNVTPEIKTATLAIEIMGKTDSLTTSLRRLAPPADAPSITLIRDADGVDIGWEWRGGLVTATVGVGDYTCSVTAEGFTKQTVAITVTKEQLGTTVTQLIELVTSGPKPINLGEYSVEWINTNSKYEPIGMWEAVQNPAQILYTASHNSMPAQYILQGWYDGTVCNEGGGVLTCDKHTSQQGSISVMTGTVTADKRFFEMKVDTLLYPGQADEKHGYSRFRMKRQ